MIQTKSEAWIDESGLKVPYDRLTKFEISKEKAAAKVVREAKKINASLKAFKTFINDISLQVRIDFYKERQCEIKDSSKGNYTWFNFDRSIKVEVSIQDRIVFDDLTIKLAKEKLDQFLQENTNPKDEIVREIINDAFSTSRGNMDVKKVTNLLKYRTRVKNVVFQEALNLIQESIRKPSSRAYFRIFEKDESGAYKLIDLNLSSIE